MTRIQSLSAQKLRAVFEILFIFFAGSWLSQFFYQWANITESPFAGFFSGSPDYFAMSASLAKILILQYLAWFVVAALMWLVCYFLLGHRLPNTSGTPRLSEATPIRSQTRTWKYYAAMVIVGWALADFGFKGIMLLDQSFQLGETVAWRDAWLRADRSVGWWLFTFVGSFGVVAVVEELFWRGLVQRWLMSYFGAPTAILLTATLFTLSHAQYHALDTYNVLMLIALFSGSLVLGYCYFKSGSLWVSIAIHAMFNFPVGEGFTPVLLILSVLVIVASRQQIVGCITHYLSTIKTTEHKCTVATALVILAATAMSLSMLPMSAVTWIGMCASSWVVFLLLEKLSAR